MLRFSNITSGPILRWKEYKRNFNDSASLFESDRDFLDNLHRISNGLLKISFFSQPLLVFILFVANLEIKTPENELLYFSFLSVVAVIYLYFLYINFSSFCDVMIGSGRLLGLHVPENFDRPFSSTNFLEFWQHWHLSLSGWFRDFIFNPIVLRMSRWNKSGNWVIYSTAYFITFSLEFGMGALGHFLVRNYVSFGAIIVILFKEIKQRNNGRFKLSSKHLIYFSQTSTPIITFHYNYGPWMPTFCYLITSHLILKAQ